MHPIYENNGLKWWEVQPLLHGEGTKHQVEAFYGQEQAHVLSPCFGFMVNIPPSCMTLYLHILHTCIHTHTQSGDPIDRPFLLGQEQYVIWSMSPVGSLSTPLSTTIPVPFRHYANAAQTGKISLGI